MNNLDRKIIIKIKDYIFRYNKDKPYKFFLYWSRVRWDIHSRSDYDIWVLWDKPLDMITKSNIQEWFDNIPALIDFTDFSQVSPEFKEIAMKNIIYLN